MVYIEIAKKNISNDIKYIIFKNITNTFNAISCDGDTSTNEPSKPQI